MRAIFFLFISVLVLSKSSSAQTFKSYADTANYLVNEIEAKKNLYIGKPFSVLWDSLKIKPVIVVEGGANKKYFGEVVAFEFNYERAFEKSHFFTIHFNNVPPYEVLYPIFFPPNGIERDFNKVISVYKSLVITEIIVKDYSQDDLYK